jgi:undecaprenyl-diphosphatase
MNFDYLFFQKINSLAGQRPILDKIGIFFAEHLPYLIGAGVAAFVIYWIVKNKNWKVLWQALAALVLSRGIITEGIRFFWHRPRPFIFHSVNLLLNHDNSGSFPSGHMTFLFALAAAVYFYNKKIGWLLFVLSFLAGVARVFIGVHYPSDILGGIIIGIFSAWLIKKIAQ